MRVFAAIILLLPLSGCEGYGAPDPWPVKTGDGTGPTLWLNYSIVNLRSDYRYAFTGPHCGTARPSMEWVRDGDGYTGRDTYESVFVEEGEYARLGERRPFVVAASVPPAVPGNGTFSSFGSEGYAGGIPFLLDPHIGADYNLEPTPIAKIDVVGGQVQVDGANVTLPYAWATARAGNWSAEFHLSYGPEDVDLFRIESCA